MLPIYIVAIAYRKDGDAQEIIEYADFVIGQLKHESTEISITSVFVNSISFRDFCKNGRSSI